MPVQVTPVRSFSDKRAFIDLPFRLHGTAGHWVPPLKLERWAFLSPRLNKWFHHADAELFLARRDGRIVGRISAQIDHALNQYQGNRWGAFGFLELEEDQEVMDALLDAAAGWLSDRGRERMVGPMDFSQNDEIGLLVEGHDRDPYVHQPWHPPSYQRMCEAAGLEKEVDLLMWELVVEDREALVPGIVELASRVEADHGIRLRKMTRRGLRRDLEVFGETYNEAWKDNWGFVPYGKDDLDTFAQELQLVFDPEWFMVAERIDTGETVGIAITIPDINQVLRKMRGRALPFGWWHYLRRTRIMDRVRVGFLGVKPEYQHTGVAAALYVEHFDVADRTRYKYGEMGWILETNEAMNRGMEGMGGRIVKRYRVYVRELEG